MTLAELLRISPPGPTVPWGKECRDATCPAWKKSDSGHWMRHYHRDQP